MCASLAMHGGYPVPRFLGLGCRWSSRPFVDLRLSVCAETSFQPARQFCINEHNGYRIRAKPF